MNKKLLMLVTLLTATSVIQADSSYVYEAISQICMKNCCNENKNITDIKNCMHECATQAMINQEQDSKGFGLNNPIIPSQNACIACLKSCQNDLTCSNKCVALFRQTEAIKAEEIAHDL